MNILAIESSSTICGTALFLNNELIEIDELNKSKVHSENLPHMINNIIKNNNVKISDLDGIAVSEGPGSYTGLRIGMSLAKGLASPFGLPIIPVPTLESINQGISIKGKYSIVLYSHKNIVYSQCYNSGKPISEIQCEEFKIDNYSKVVGFNLNKICDSKLYVPCEPSAKYIGKLAILNYQDWAQTDLSIIIPNYVTNFNLGNKI